MQISMSVSEGTHSPKHNLDMKHRSKEPHIEAEKTHLNVILRGERVEEAYRRLFDDAIANYNAQQIEKGHPERCKKDYYAEVCKRYSDAKAAERKSRIEVAEGTRKKIKKCNVPQPCVEWVLQFGNMETSKDLVNLLGKEGVDNLYRRVLEIASEKGDGAIDFFQAVINWDEASPHLHATAIFYENNPSTRGMDCQVTKAGAKRKLGVETSEELREVLWDAMEEAGREFGLERLYMDNHESHLSAAEYREKMRVLDKFSEKIDEKKRTAAELETNISFAQLEKFSVEVNVANQVELLNQQQSLIETRSDLADAEKRRLDRLQGKVKTTEERLDVLEAKAQKAEEKTKNYNMENEKLAAKKEELVKETQHEEASLRKMKSNAAEEKRCLEEELKPLREEAASLKREVAALKEEKTALGKIVDRFWKRLNDMAQIALNMFSGRELKFISTWGFNDKLKDFAKNGNDYAAEILDSSDGLWWSKEWEMLTTQTKDSEPSFDALIDFHTARQKLEKDAKQEVGLTNAQAAAIKKKRTATKSNTPAPRVTIDQPQHLPEQER